MIRGEHMTQVLLDAASEWVGQDAALDDAARQQVYDAARECVRHLPEHHRCTAVWEELCTAFFMGMATMRELARRGHDG